MSNYDLASIQSMVQKDYAISQQLLALLQDETLFIKQGDYEQVKDVLLNKAPLLDQLKQHANIRKNWLLSLYKVADENNWQTFLASFNQPSINEQWQELTDTIAQCKQVNEANGVMIHRGQRTHSTLIRLLKGDNNPTELYNSRGAKGVTRSGYSVAKA